MLLLTLPVNQIDDATDQSREIKPHGCVGMKNPAPDGWITVDCVKFHVGSQMGGGHGSPLSAHEGDGSGPEGE